MWRFRKTNRSRERGQALVEFLLSAVFLLTTVFAVIEMLVFVYTYVVMAQAAKAGVRYAIVHGSSSTIPSGPSDYTAVENVVKYYADYPGMTITVSYPDAAPENHPPNRVRVELVYPFSLLPLGWALPSVRASAQGRIFF